MPTAVIQDKKLSACQQMKSEQTIHHKKLYQPYARIITPSKSIDNIYQAMKGLDTAEKYSLLFNHVRPPTTDQRILLGVIQSLELSGWHSICG